MEESTDLGGEVARLARLGVAGPRLAHLREDRDEDLVARAADEALELSGRTVAWRHMAS